MSIEDHDKEVIHCRMLGHDVPFSYCRTGATGQPCRKIFDCWFHTFDIVSFMKEHYPEEEIEAIQQPPKNRMMTLVELIEKAKNNK